MSTIRIRIHQQGWAEVTLDRETYEAARRAHQGDGNGLGAGALDKLLQGAISGMDTEITIIEMESSGSTYDL